MDVQETLSRLHCPGTVGHCAPLVQEAPVELQVPAIVGQFEFE